MARTNAQRQRAIRQDALREQLAEQCRVQHIIDNLNKIEQLDPSAESFANELNKLKASNEQRIKIMGKYLPELKATELSGEVNLPQVVTKDLSGE